MDTAIAIRTVVVTGDRAYVQAGAGIVARIGQVWLSRAELYSAPMNRPLSLCILAVCAGAVSAQEVTPKARDEAIVRALEPMRWLTNSCINCQCTANGTCCTRNIQT